MGFFSAIKKFLGNEPTEKEKMPNPPEEGVSKPDAEESRAQEHAPDIIQETEEKAGQAEAVEESAAPQEVMAHSLERVAPLEQEETTEPVMEPAVEPAVEPVTEPAVEPAQISSPLIEPSLTQESHPQHSETFSDSEQLASPVQSQVHTFEGMDSYMAASEYTSSEPASVSDTASVVSATTSITETPATSTSDANPEASASVFAIEGLSAEDQWALSLALRGVEPRLSAWLGVVLEGVDTASPLLWQRLRYLLHSLNAKAEEATAFVDDFSGWLTRMEYEYVEEFRSELQYRLALALDLEDEEDERNRLFVKLSDGLARTREQFTRKLDVLFASHGALDAAFWEEMEELFIMADVGFDSSMQLIERLKDGVRKQGLSQPQELRALLQEEVEKIFQMPKRISSFNPPEVIMMVGVNGVGKTTTIAKLAHRDRMQGKKVLIAAADTFRAAATEQLGVWAERVGADFHRKEAGADPAAVAFEAMDIALRHGYDVIYIDTAGRLQTKVNLMEELKKIRQVIGKKHEGAPHRCILVIDATTGQNALSQTKMFSETSGVDEIILSKLDGTAKGGVAISVAMQFAIPITYVGLGEKLEDLRPFNGKDFAVALLGVEDTPK